MRKLLSAAVLVAVATAAGAAGPVADGNWLLATYSTPNESAQAILKVETKEGKPTATLVFSPAPVGRRGNAPKPEIVGFKVDGQDVSFSIRNGESDATFAGKIGPDGKKIVGNFGSDPTFVRAWLTPTDKTTLARNELSTPAKDAGSELFRNVITLQEKYIDLQSKVRAETDAEKKAELTKEATAAMREYSAAIPKTYKEILVSHKDTPAALDAAMYMTRMARTTKPAAADVEEWVKVIETQAPAYGPRYAKATLHQVADGMAADKGLAPIAIRIVEPIVAGFSDKDKAAFQSKVLTTLKNAKEALALTTEVAAIEDRIAKLEPRVDAEYLASVPPFKPEPYAGRKEKEANKVAVLELFTGAQCPPCVAADVAFDALDKSYKPTDLLLLQYHMHIPGPDPLTNPDTIGRWDYYRAKFPEGIRGTPSTVFNGKPGAGGGGGMANAQGKFNQYKGLIDPILEEKTDVKVAGNFGRTGDKITVSATVSGVEPTDDLKLRLVVVEENIKYIGSNQLRFHHQVVRHLIGGPAGVKVSDKTFTHTAAADVADIKKGLTTYLDEFHANRPFPYKHRPMDLGHLKVIALVQNDKTLEILQAAELTPGAVKTSTTIDQK